MTDYTPVWDEIYINLVKAHSLLLGTIVNPTDADLKDLDDFVDYLDENELGIAWDCLNDVGLRNKTSSEFWDVMNTAHNILWP